MDVNMDETNQIVWANAFALAYSKGETNEKASNFAEHCLKMSIRRCNEGELYKEQTGGEG